MSVELKDIYLSYSSGPVKLDIFTAYNLKVKTGDFAALMGPSGGGKTSLLNLVAGFLYPSAGTVMCNGQNISEMSAEEKARFRNRHIGFVFQFFNLIKQFNARDNVALPLRLAGVGVAESKARAMEKLAQVGIEARWRHFPNELSGGEQQRVAIARALITDPSLILADEPTGNLDKSNTEKIIELLSDCRKGRTIVLATHDPTVAAAADRIIEL